MVLRCKIKGSLASGHILDSVQHGLTSEGSRIRSLLEDQMMPVILRGFLSDLLDFLRAIHCGKVSVFSLFRLSLLQ